jgi:fermentation-respiration switch protein FrsA (DUF1100 family)
MKIWTDNIRSMDRKLMEIKSFDGLTLRGYYYEYSPNSPLELIFHGYSGNAERDLSGGVERCFALGRSAILIDQRGAGMSEGKISTFGVNERRDCLSWIEFATQKFGKERPLIIGGISMGAATVMMASGENLPENVVCVMADCGYSSPKEIICKVVRDMKLPVKLLYPFIKLGARIYGGFDLEEASPIDAMKKCSLPIVFVHGDADDFVPYDMSVRLCEACASEKKILITVPEAGHGLAYPKDREGYVNQLNKIYDEWNIR